MSTGAASFAAHLPGVLAALLTPFRPDTEEVDDAALARECDWVVACRPAAVVVAGVETQEYQVLEGSRREVHVARCLELLGGRVPTIVGVTHPSLTRSRQLCEFAASAGADAVMVLAAPKPWGARPTSAEVTAVVDEVAEAAGLPVVVYNNPRVGVDLTVDEMAVLAAHGGVSAFKETSRDLNKLGRLLTEVDAPGSARVFTTVEALLFTLMMGGPGAMMPAPAVGFGEALVDAVVRSDFELAVKIQRLLLTFPGKWMRLGLTPVMKVAMKQLGVDVGSPLRPYASLDDAEVEELGALLSGMLDFAAPLRDDVPLEITE